MAKRGMGETGRTLLHGVAVGAMLSIACGGGASPAAPAPPGMVFAPGGYWLRISALDGEALCVPSPSTGVRTRTTNLMLTRDGDEWVGRAALPRDGDLVVRLRERPATGPVVAITGTASGTGVTAIGVDGSPALAVVLDGVALRGDGVIGDGRALGTLAGPMAFTETRAAPLLCNSASWSLARSPAP
jgi:hypothetical protein